MYVVNQVGSEDRLHKLTFSYSATSTGIIQKFYRDGEIIGYMDCNQPPQIGMPSSPKLVDEGICANSSLLLGKPGDFKKIINFYSCGPDGNISVSGSGFLITQNCAVIGGGKALMNFIVSATHVIDVSTHYGPASQKVSLFQAISSAIRNQSSHLIEIDRDIIRSMSDVSVFPVAKHFGSRYGVTSCGQVAGARKVACTLVGVDSALDSPVTSHGQVVDRCGTPSFPFLARHTCSAFPGNSGSPIFNYGKVCGVHKGADHPSAVTDPSSRANYMVVLWPIVRLLCGALDRVIIDEADYCNDSELFPEGRQNQHALEGEDPELSFKTKYIVTDINNKHHRIDVYKSGTWNDTEENDDYLSYHPKFRDQDRPIDQDEVESSGGYSDSDNRYINGFTGRDESANMARLPKSCLEGSSPLPPKIRVNALVVKGSVEASIMAAAIQQTPKAVGKTPIVRNENSDFERPPVKTIQEGATFASVVGRIQTTAPLPLVGELKSRIRKPKTKAEKPSLEVPFTVNQLQLAELKQLQSEISRALLQSTQTSVQKLLPTVGPLKPPVKTLSAASSVKSPK
jgi:hypothetical protein